MRSQKRLWFKIIKRRNMSFNSGHYFIFLYNRDEKNYENPCIRPKLGLCYINLSWQYPILPLSYLKFCPSGRNTHLKWTQFISFLLRSLYHFLSTIEPILFSFFPQYHILQVFGILEFLWGAFITEFRICILMVNKMLRWWTNRVLLLLYLILMKWSYYCEPSAGICQ